MPSLHYRPFLRGGKKRDQFTLHMHWHLLSNCVSIVTDHGAVHSYTHNDMDIMDLWNSQFPQTFWDPSAQTHTMHTRIFSLLGSKAPGYEGLAHLSLLIGCINVTEA